MYGTRLKFDLIVSDSLFPAKAAVLALEILSGSRMSDNTLSNVQRKDL